MEHFAMPEERLLVIRPFTLFVSENNACAGAMLSLCLDRQNRFGWNEHHVTLASLRHDMFEMYGERAATRAFNLLVELGVFVLIKKHRPGRQKPFRLNMELLAQKRDEYESKYPLTKSKGSHARSEVKTEPKPLSHNVTDKKQLRNPLTRVTKPANDNYLYKEITKEIEKEIVNNNTGMDQKQITCKPALLEPVVDSDFDHWVDVFSELQQAIEAEQAKGVNSAYLQGLEEAALDSRNTIIQRRSERYLQQILEAVSKEKKGNLNTIDDPIDMNNPHGAVTNPLSQSFYSQQKCAQERVLTDEHRRRLSYYAQRFGNDISEMEWFVKNEYTSQGYSLSRVMSILGRIAPHFTRPHGMPLSVLNNQIDRTKQRYSGLN